MGGILLLKLYIIHQTARKIVRWAPGLCFQGQADIDAKKLAALEAARSAANAATEEVERTARVLDVLPRYRNAEVRQQRHTTSKDGSRARHTAGWYIHTCMHKCARTHTYA